jgi:GT2 family glycosyltransferase
METRLLITTYNRPDELVRAVDAAWASDQPLAEVVVIDNSPEHYAHTLLLGKATVITLPHAAGLGPCLNLAFALYDDYLICSNDDLTVRPQALRALVEAAERQPADALFYGSHNGEDMWSLFLLRKQAFLETGGFDPAIWPLYYDDIDMLYRLKLLGYTPVTVREAVYDHVHNGTIKVFDAKRKDLHDRQFYRNEAFYKTKWGGLKFEERFTQPFDGKRPTVPPLIKV